MKNYVASYVKYASIRDNKKMIDAQVARLSNINKSTFSDWKSGRSCPGINKLMRIAKVLKEPVESFIAL